MKKICGFTLIEVLIALAILSIALTAIIQATSQNIRDNIYLQNKTIANWVGNLLMNQALAGILQLPTSGNNESSMLMLGQNWLWQGTLENTPNPHIQKIRIQVFDASNHHLLTNLESYLYVENK